MMTIGRILGAGLAAAALVACGIWLGGRHAAVSSASVAPTGADQRPTPRAHVAESAAYGHDRRPALAPTTTITPGLVADLRDADPHVRRAAVAEVASSAAPDPQLLLAASHDDDLHVALAATDALGGLYRDGRIPASELIVRATDHRLPEKVRVTALDALGMVASTDGAATLIDLLAHGDAIDRRSAAILLAHQDPAAAVPALIDGLRDADEIVVANAHDSLHALARGRDFGSDAGAWQRWWQTRTI